MHSFFPFGLILVAGVLNGSFAMPLKHCSSLEHHVLWFLFSLLALWVLPLSCLSLFVANPLDKIALLSPHVLLTLFIGGICFGVGQLSYCSAFRYIGLSLNCIINIAIGTSIVGLLGLIQKPTLILTSYGKLQALGITCFLIAVILGGLAGHRRHQNQVQTQEKALANNKPILHRSKKYLFLGIVLAVIAGCGVAAEGTAFAMASHEQVKITVASISSIDFSIIFWSLLFMSAGVPYSLFFLFSVMRHRKSKQIFQHKHLVVFFNLALMAVCYFVPLLIFSYATFSMKDDFAVTISWPLFMSLVVLVANGWGVLQGEWAHVTQGTIRLFISSIIMLLLAIIIFSFQL